jgi:hypothetical protein
MGISLENIVELLLKLKELTRRINGVRRGRLRGIVSVCPGRSIGISVSVVLALKILPPVCFVNLLF